MLASTCLYSFYAWLGILKLAMNITNIITTIRVSRRRREMRSGHGRLRVCLSLAAFPHYCTDPDVTWDLDVCEGCPKLCTIRHRSSTHVNAAYCYRPSSVNTRLYATAPLTPYDTIRYDTVYLRAPKSCQSQLNLPHGTKQKTVMKKTKTSNRDAQKKRSSHKVRGVSPEAGREPTLGKICERGRS